MEIDAYQLCPCQCGKKIKFCCAKNVVGELNEILNKSKSGQVKAALEKIERTIKKVGNQDCLLVVKTQLLILIDEFELARESNQTFSAQAPGHPMALQHQALLDVVDRNFKQAVFHLQDAMDARKGVEIPVVVSDAFIVLGKALHLDGSTLAGLAHFRFAKEMSDQSNAAIDAIEAIVYDRSTLPFLCQSPLVEPYDGDASWGGLYQKSLLAVQRGQFRRALQYLMKIDNDFEQQPIVVRSIAATKSMLAMDDAADAWKRYASIPGLNSTLAAEALAFAYCESDLANVPDPIKVFKFELEDVDRTVETLLASKLFEPVETPASTADGSPPPKHGFAIVSQPIARQNSELTVDDIAYRIGNAELYGNRTDRPARLEVWVAESRAEQVLDLINRIGLDLPEPKIDQSEGQSWQQDVLLGTQCLMPEDIDPQHFNELAAEETRHRILIQVPNSLTLDRNHDLTIAEAAKRPELKNLIYAKLLILVSNSHSRYAPLDAFDELLEQLQLPPMDALDAESPLVLQSPIRYRSIDLSQLTLAQLNQIVNAGYEYNDARMIETSLTETLGREDRDQTQDAHSFMSLFYCASNPLEALERIVQAIQAAQRSGDDEVLGKALCAELDLRLSMSEVEAAQEILRRLNDLREIESVQYELIQIFQKYNLLDLLPASGSPGPRPQRESRLILPE